MMDKEKKVAVQVENLYVNFYKDQVLSGISEQFLEKTITVLVGRSGSGKTTFLRSLNRLNEVYAGCQMMGHISVDIGFGLQNIDTDSEKVMVNIQEIRRKVGMLFQTPQLLPVSIYRNVSMPLELIGGYSKKVTKLRVEEVLNLVGLWDEVKDRLDYSAKMLSGGQQQRLCLARTLALEPKILLLDEPTSSLDVHATQQIEALLLKLKASYTLILVSHSLEQAIRLGDRLILFDQGKIIEECQGDDGFKEETITRWFSR